MVRGQLQALRTDASARTSHSRAADGSLIAYTEPRACRLREVVAAPTPPTAAPGFELRPTSNGFDAPRVSNDHRELVLDAKPHAPPIRPAWRRVKTLRA